MSSMKSVVVWSLLTICCAEILTPVASGSLRRRQKRIINGVKIDQHNRIYEVTKWYVWIGDGHECNRPDAWLHNCAKRENLKCGGSLLTPDIVQTSCECLAAFIGPRQQNVTKACVLNTWEKMHVIFVAVRDVEAMVDGYMSLAFYIHQKCGKLAADPRYLTTHDFGFIKLRRGVKQRSRDIAIRFAPIYSIRNLVKLWTYNINGGVVCMTTGYGSSALEETSGMPLTQMSDAMLHSWVVIYDYLRCYYMLKIPDNNGTYLELATWWCMSRLPNKGPKTYLAPGDGGSPLACNDHYLGIVSPHVHHLENEFTLQFSSGIAFTPYQNAIEFRENFQKSLKLLVNDPTFAPTFATIFPLAQKASSATRVTSHICVSAFYIANHVLIYSHTQKFDF